MDQHPVVIENLPGEIVDIDVTQHGAWVAVCKVARNKFMVASLNGNFAAPAEVRYPLVRWMDNGDVLLVDTRTGKGQSNAYVHTLEGLEVARWCVGDGVQNVLVIGNQIVVTYFDEGVFGDVPPSSEGLCVFTADGTLEFGYQSGVKGAVEISDCYCACAAGRHEVCFSPYRGFPLVRLNLKTRDQVVHALPAALAGSSALATDGVTFYFYSPYQAKRALLRWRPGEEAHQIGTHPGPLRGHGRAAFIAQGQSGYTLVTPAR